MAARAGTGTDLDAVLEAARVLVAINAGALAAVTEVADPTQVRVLTVIAARQPVSLGAVAEAAGLIVSTASRLCDRMVAVGLVDRRTDPSNRRTLSLSVSAKGQSIIDALDGHRRAALAPILERLPVPRQHELAELLREFADAAALPLGQLAE